VGKHDDHGAKTTGDGQVAKGTVIPSAPRDDGAGTAKMMGIAPRKTRTRSDRARAAPHGR
jgi:hypothetical protein